jgi:hypothetical protein
MPRVVHREHHVDMCICVQVRARFSRYSPYPESRFTAIDSHIHILEVHISKGFSSSVCSDVEVWQTPIDKRVTLSFSFLAGITTHSVFARNRGTRASHNEIYAATPSVRALSRLGSYRPQYTAELIFVRNLKIVVLNSALCSYCSATDGKIGFTTK